MEPNQYRYIRYFFSNEVNTLFQVMWHCYMQKNAQYFVLKPPMGSRFGQNHGILDIRLFVLLAIWSKFMCNLCKTTNAGSRNSFLQ